MEFLLDAASLAEIQEAVDYLPVAGVVCGPQALEKEKPADFFAHLRKIRDIIGPHRSLHVQPVSRDTESMVNEAHRILDEVDDDIAILIPATFEGLRAIRILKKDEVTISAAAVCDELQALLVLEAGADWILTSDADQDLYQSLHRIAERISHDKYRTKVVSCVTTDTKAGLKCLEYGADGIVIPYEKLKSVFANPHIEQAIEIYQTDWRTFSGDEENGR